jgi:hypothetical protein
MRQELRALNTGIAALNPALSRVKDPNVPRAEKRSLNPAGIRREKTILTTELVALEMAAGDRDPEQNSRDSNDPNPEYDRSSDTTENDASLLMEPIVVASLVPRRGHGGRHLLRRLHGPVPEAMPAPTPASTATTKDLAGTMTVAQHQRPMAPKALAMYI